MFYISLTSLGAFLALGFYSLIVYRFKVWRWWLPGLIAGLLAVPEILNKAQTAVTRVEATQTLNRLPLFPALSDLLWRYTGHLAVVWAGLLVIAAILIFMRHRFSNRHTTTLLLWVFAMPLLLSAGVLAFVEDRFPEPPAWRAWVAGIVVPAVLTFPPVVVTLATDPGPDEVIVIGAFLAALIALIVGHMLTRERAGWWLGNAVVALIWVVLFITVATAMRGCCGESP